MSEQKQIEEMAKVIFESSPLPEMWMSHARICAEALYDEGYRKQNVGEWIMERTPTFYHYYTCSVCGWDFCREDSQIDEKFLEGSDLLYCPNCGSKMRGGVD